MILNVFRIKVAPQNRADAVKTIKGLIGPTNVKSGCQKCSLYAHVDNDDDLLLLEKWSSQEVLEKHIISDSYRLLLAALELANQKPEVEFHTVSSTSGLELVERLR